MKPIYLLAFLALSGCATTAAKFRAPASDALPKCWKAYDPKLHDGLYHVTIPASDALTARDVQRMIMSLQAFGVASHTVTAMGSDSIVLEAQFVTLDQGRNLGYPTQEKLEELVAYVLKDDLAYLEKGVTISCLAERPLKRS